MSQTNLIPFNIDLLIPDRDTFKNIRQIKVLDIYEGMSKSFHPDGLFSIDIFGRKGEDKRNITFGYIDLRVTIIHPVIFKALNELKHLYGDIISGKEYAVFNKETKDFDKASPISDENARTGYSFFVEHLKDIKFEERPSIKREHNIKLIEKYKDNCLYSKIIVMPAGLRDFEIDENGRSSEDEINSLYRNLLSMSSTLENVDIKLYSSYIENTRYNIQLKVIEIYDYIKNMLEGKGKLILGKWASRKIFNSTRNVITSYIPDATNMNDKRIVSANETVVGIYQYLKAILPLAINLIRDGFLSSVFIGPNAPVFLVNKTTLKKEYVTIDSSYYDNWMTFEGLEQLIAKFGQEYLRNLPLTIEDNYYLGLIYKGKDNTYRFLQDISELPENRSIEDVYPLTFCELLYLSVYKQSRKIPCLVTRYPITGFGSIYPSYSYLKTTVKSEIRKELGINWEPTGEEAIEFPISNMQYYSSFSPHVKNLGRLSGDFDKQMLHTSNCPTN